MVTSEDIKLHICNFLHLFDGKRKEAQETWETRGGQDMQQRSPSRLEPEKVRLHGALGF